MINVLATNITSPIGLSTEENYLNVRKGGIAISTIQDWNGIPGQISVGIFPEDVRKSLMVDGYTWYESLIIRSVTEASTHTDIDFKSGKLGLIICTTKGNVEAIDDSYDTGVEYSAPGVSARKVAGYLGMTTTPVVVCNACISGVTAQVLADRYISSGTFDTVIVCGADTVNRFCLAGFTSFKSLSPYPCRPFDIDRLGLNIGECASTMILSSGRPSGEAEDCWQMISSHLDNDAYHISAPSPSGEGVCRAITNTLKESGGVAPGCICAHGTATMFNDQMESKAISAAGLSGIPIMAFKGIYGHTFGAAGVIETVLAMRSLHDGVVLPVAGFGEMGVSGKINISNRERTTETGAFLKILSGFGGCNGAVLYSRGKQAFEPAVSDAGYELVKKVRITPDCVEIDGVECDAEGRNSALITELYKKYLDDNTRYYKMDTFSRLAYVASGLLLSGRQYDAENVSMMFFNRSSSIVADRHHIESFNAADNFYPSPAVFINTLPNVVMGEISIKYNIKGETTLLILPEKDEKLIATTINDTLSSHRNSYMVTGWVDCESDDIFEVDLKLIKIN